MYRSGDYVDVSVLPKNRYTKLFHIYEEKSLSNTISNFANDICGMDNAMKYVKTKYCIRTRGDDIIYENLDNFIEKIFENKNKLYLEISFPKDG